MLLAAPSPAPAAGIRVEPGLWEFTTSIPDPSGDGGPQVYRTCIREREITPAVVMARHDECRITNARFAAASARWAMRCRTPAGPMDGSGSLKTNGTAVSGTLEFTMMLGALEVPLSGDFRGRRLGDCRPTAAAAPSGRAGR